MSADRDKDDCAVTELYFDPPGGMSMGDSKPIAILAVQIARAKKDLTVYLIINSAGDLKGSMSFIRPYSEHLYGTKVTDDKKDGFFVENLRVLVVSQTIKINLRKVGNPLAKSAYITSSLYDHDKSVQKCAHGGKLFDKCFLLDFGDNSIQGGLCDLENVSSSPPVSLRFALKELDDDASGKSRSYFPPLFFAQTRKFFVLDTRRFHR